MSLTVPLPTKLMAINNTIHSRINTTTQHYKGFHNLHNYKVYKKKIRNSTQKISQQEPDKSKLHRCKETTEINWNKTIGNGQQITWKRTSTKRVANSQDPQDMENGSELSSVTLSRMATLPCLSWFPSSSKWEEVKDSHLARQAVSQRRHSITV